MMSETTVTGQTSDEEFRSALEKVARATNLMSASRRAAHAARQLAQEEETRMLNTLAYFEAFLP